MQVIQGTKGGLIKAWIDGVQVEEEARKQLDNIASMPFIHSHVAIMPDVHYGLGATIGSVIPTRGAIIPAAVGVDLGCTDADTEFLTRSGWKRIADYVEGDDVLIYDVDKKESYFAKPLAYVKKPSEGFYHFKTKYGINQMLSSDHRMLTYQAGRERKFEKVEVLSAKEVAERHEDRVLGFGNFVKTTPEKIIGIESRLEMDVHDIRVAVMIAADGHVDGPSTVLHFTKSRKFFRALQLLEAAEIEPISVKERFGHYVIRIQNLLEEKTLGTAIWWKASADQCKVIAEEVLYWDGSHDQQCFYTRKKQEADFVQWVFMVAGKRSVLRRDIHKRDGKIDYRVFFTENTCIGMKANPKSTVEFVPSPDGMEYCFTVETGFFLIRRKGVTVITGNCGMMAQRTSLVASDLPDSLSALRTFIEERIPHGRTDNGGPNDRGAWGEVPVDNQMKFTGLGEYASTPSGGMNALNLELEKIVEKHPKLTRASKRSPHHIGTLGTGNHFVEICLDEEDRVWIMLHSGSRGIGNAIGSYFIELAKNDMRKWFINLPDADLAYFPEGTDHFKDYLQGIRWAQRFAMMNRESMMNAALEALSLAVPKEFALSESAVNCFSRDTRFITDNGLRSFGESCGSRVTVINSNGQWTDAEVKSFGYQNLVKLTLGRFDAVKTIYTTAGHKWFVDNLQRTRKEKTTAELVPGDRLAFQRPVTLYDGFDLSMQYRGFTYGDGSKNSINTSLANFCGPKQPLVEYFAATGLGNNPRAYGNTIRVTGLPKEWKTDAGVARDLLYFAEPNHIAGWLSGYFAADGDIDETGRPTMTSARLDDLELYRDLCWKIGIATYPIRFQMRYGYGQEMTPIYMMGISRNDITPEFFIREEHRSRVRYVDERLNWRVLNVEETGIMDEVFCLEVPDTHSFVLEDGILTSNCHHNYVREEKHFGKSVLVTRKGAVRITATDLGIIPGSMGAKSFIVRGIEGEAHAQALCSCSHGAGRSMSRRQAKKRFTVEDHVKATAGIECRKDEDVLDETPMAYKPIEDVMAAQADHVEVVHTLRQVVCVKG